MRILCLFLGLLILSSPAWAVPGNHEEFKIDVNGVERLYMMHIPIPTPVNLAEGLPVVIVLHGGRSSAEQIKKATRFSDKADKFGFIAVYPYGSGKLEDTLLTWNVDQCCDLEWKDKPDDLAFLNALIDKLVKFQGANPKRIYLAGMSNGGMLAHRAGAALSHKIAAIGVVEGGTFNDQPAPQSPVPIIMIHGLADKTVPFEGGKPTASGIKPYMKPESVFLPIKSTYNFWREKNGCTGTESIRNKGNITVYTTANCKNGTLVTLHTIKNSGHNWPGSVKAIYSEFDDGSNYMGYDATDILWEFFASKRKAP